MERGSIKKVEFKQKTGGRKKFNHKLSPSQIKILTKRVESALTHPMHIGKNKFEYIVQILGLYVVNKWKKPTLACIGCPHITSKDLMNFLNGYTTLKKEDHLPAEEDQSRIAGEININEIICKKEEEEEQHDLGKMKVIDDQTLKMFSAISTSCTSCNFVEEERAIHEVNCIVKKEEGVDDDVDKVQITKSSAFKPDPMKFLVKIVLSTVKSLKIQDLLFQGHHSGKITSSVLKDFELKTMIAYMEF